ncbi:MAG: AI-2E family transporter [Anaerolineales bacterium]|nr:AI-2E family transporter [Anaerolineales bacterium]
MQNRNVQQPSPPWEPGTRLIAAFLLLVLTGVLLYRLRELFSLVIIAFLLAFLLFPLVLRLQHAMKAPRWVAVLIVYLIMLALIGGAGTGVGVALAQSVISLISELENVAAGIPDQVQELLMQKFVIGPWMIDLAQFNFETVVSDFVGVVQSVLFESGTFLASLAGRAATTVGLVLSIFVFGFYLLLDFDKTSDAFLALVPGPYRRDIQKLLKDTSLLWSSFFRGQLILGLAVGLLTTLFLTILGTNFTLGLGVIAGFLELIPGFGPFISACVGVLVAIFQSGNWMGLTSFWYAVVVLGAFLLVQQIENNLLVPKIIGHSLNLPPLVVLLAVLAGGYLFGLFGILLAAPLTATLRLWVGYIYRKTVGLETWPAPLFKTREEVQIPEMPQFVRNFIGRITNWIRSTGPFSMFSDGEEEELNSEETPPDEPGTNPE